MRPRPPEGGRWERLRPTQGDGVSPGSEDAAAEPSAGRGRNRGSLFGELRPAPGAASASVAAAEGAPPNVAEAAELAPGEARAPGGAIPGPGPAAVGTTTAYYDSRAWEPRIGAKALETMSEMGAGASETGTELQERVAGIAQVLTENGHTEEEVAVAMRVEYMKVQLAEE